MNEQLSSEELASALYSAALVVDKNGITKSRAKYAELLRAAGRRITALQAAHEGVNLPAFAELMAERERLDADAACEKAEHWKSEAVRLQRESAEHMKLALDASAELVEARYLRAERDRLQRELWIKDSQYTGTRKRLYEVEQQELRLRAALCGMIEAVRDIEIDKASWDLCVAHRLQAAYRALPGMQPADIAREALGPAEGTAPNAVETICEACSERFITNLPGWCLKCKATADKLRRILVAREALGPAQET